MELNEYDKDAVISSGYITSSTPITTGYDLAAGGIQRSIRTSSITPSELIEQYNRMTPALRKALAQQLKDAGFKVPVTGRYDTTVRSAFLSANEALSTEISYLSQNDPQRLSEVSYDLTSFLEEQSRSLGDGDGINVRKDVRIADETTARTLINAVLKDALGRGATKEELKKYTSLLQQAQRDAPTVTTTNISGDVASYQTTGGLDEGQFLIQEIAGTDEAKANKVFNYYNLGRGNQQTN
jgi:hypothetical protein